jgi:hypothetical protein
LNVRFKFKQKITSEKDALLEERANLQNELTKKTSAERDLSAKIGELQQNITQLTEVQVRFNES